MEDGINDDSKDSDFTQSYFKNRSLVKQRSKREISKYCKYLNTLVGNRSLSLKSGMSIENEGKVESGQNNINFRH